MAADKRAVAQADHVLGVFGLTFDPGAGLIGAERFKALAAQALQHGDRRHRGKAGAAALVGLGRKDRRHGGAQFVIGQGFAAGVTADIHSAHETIETHFFFPSKVV